MHLGLAPSRFTERTIVLNFVDISRLHSLLTAIHKAQEGPVGIPVFEALLQEKLEFTLQQAREYSATVLTRNSNGSADFVNMNAYKLVGKWSKGNSSGSAGNLVVTRTESWIFKEDLTYENKYESYEGYMSPFGGGYSRPSSSSTFGIWAPCDVLASPISIITIDSNGFSHKRRIEWTEPDQSMPKGMLLNGERFAKM